MAAFTDDEIRAIVKTGELSDPRAADWIAECLIKRRDKIVQAWFSRVLPLDSFRVVDGRLSFDDLGARHEIGNGPVYDVRWSSFDNHHHLTELPGARGMTIPAMAGDIGYLAATITCNGSAEGSCANPVTVYLRRAGTEFQVAGIDR